MKTVFILLILVFHCSVFAQKDEYERRIDKKDVPVCALNWVEKIEHIIKKPKWYEETTSGEKSFEIKFTSDGQFFSVEFDTIGNVEDVEIRIKEKDVESDISDKIDKDLKEKFVRYKIVKIQIQYTSEANDIDLMNCFIGENTEGLTRKYEIEFEAKSTSKWQMYEGTFSHGGHLLFLREIDLRSMENLNY